MIWPFRKPCPPPGDDRVRQAAPVIAAQERQLAELTQKREAIQREISKALDQLTGQTKENH
ncbi:hypothetical protein P775_08475 [Puniceibacterium antarcticum]|uniref:Uncharacterized protein n=1 Tax=Puniceibacterium antarcticum TaxID=1206336 RepID=A0A2G8RG50_9RHOB|nr:hypothetical protein [Puniceibacterium antarcticum]PIL20555.1 hypothetical protein P775_08475 [Puniceibacterium antarcticum]